ncbi:hypothetical protein IJ670_02035 [bacterium]|nr:hypothetical protein [bacterium]
MLEKTQNSKYMNSISDYGAMRTLGLSGSLINWIDTGNYSKNVPDISHKTNKDRYITKKQPNKGKNLSDIVNILALGAVCLTAIVSLINPGSVKSLHPIDFIKTNATKLISKFKSTPKP